MRSHRVNHFVILAAICVFVLSSRASAQTMNNLFTEWVAFGGMNVTYTLDDTQGAKLKMLVDAVNAETGAQLTATKSVVLYYVDHANVRNSTGLIGNGRANWLAFLGVALTPTGGTEIIGLHAFTDNPALAAYFEKRGLTGYVTVVDDIAVKWVLQKKDGVDTRSLNLKVNHPTAKVRLEVNDLPLTVPQGAEGLNGIRFYVRNLPHPEMRIGIENSVEQFLGNLATLDYDVEYPLLDVPVTVGATTVQLKDLFPGNVGVTRIRTESRLWRWWLQ